MKGKTVRTKPKATVNYYVDILQELKDTHQKIKLFADIMYIQGHIFPVTIFRKIGFILIQEITDRKITILYKLFDHVFKVYNQAGLHIQGIEAYP